MKLKTHFEPYLDEYAEVFMCGTFVNFETPQKTSSNWKYVTCKKCLKNKKRFEKSIELDEKHIVGQMGDFVEHCKQNENCS